MAKVMKVRWDPETDRPVAYYEEEKSPQEIEAERKAFADNASARRVSDAMAPGQETMRIAADWYRSNPMAYPLALGQYLGGAADAGIGWLTAQAANSGFNPFVETPTERDRFQRELKQFADVSALAAGQNVSPKALMPKASNVKVFEEAAVAPESGAVIRLDNEFRGHGPVSISIPDNPQKPYAVRLTGLDQIDDMIASGVVRPKVGGYGKQNKATLYFGESDTTGPTFFTSLSDEKGARIVADSKKIAGRSEYIPINDLKHVFVLRDGKEVDILEDILKQNKNWGN
jgi:hypothetical protein